jgi:ADP-ribose pyrophosphatase
VLIGSQDIYEGRVVKLRVDTIEVADGINVRREIVDHPGAVVIVPVDGEGRVLWIRQYRYAVDKELFELPAGTLEQGEDPKSCAMREVAEETGFAATELEALGHFYTAPGFCTEFMHAFAATGLRQAPDAHADDDEDIEVEPLTIDESLARYICAGTLADHRSRQAITGGRHGSPSDPVHAHFRDCQHRLPGLQ